MDILRDLGIFVAGGGAAGLGAVALWSLSEVRRLSRRVAALETERQHQPEPQHRADAVADAWSAVRLLELGLSDSLDGLVRINPEAAKSVVRRVAPHLFGDKVG